MSTAVFCVVADHPQADRIVADLAASGFSNHEISVVLPKPGDAARKRDAARTGEGPEFADDLDTKAPQGVAAGAVTGGVLGGALGWLVGIGSLALPGVGPLIVAGPLMAILSGVAVGGTMGGIAGMLVGMGIPEAEAHRYESKVGSGSVLISVHSEDAQSMRNAEEIFRRGGGEHISRSSDSTVSGRQE